MIPDFDPLNDNVTAWLNIINTHATTFAWSDSMIRYQALNKLKGSAKTWYDSLLRNSSIWTAWQWREWEKKISSTFQIKRSMFGLLKEIVDKKPVQNQSLYEFFFEQKSKIDGLNVNFSEQDIVSIILGNIGDANLTAAVEASNSTTCDSLAGFLHSRTFKTDNLKSKVDINVKKEVNMSNVSFPSTSQSYSAGSSRTNEVKQKTIACYVCGGDHKKAQCEVKCGFCQRKGHLESVCYAKKKQEL